jgi:hypothetical protein
MKDADYYATIWRECPQCGARPGEKCRNYLGNRCAPHSGRRKPPEVKRRRVFRPAGPSLFDLAEGAQ